MDPLTGSALIGAGAEGASLLANGFMQQRSAAYNQRMYEKNQAANFEYSMQAQRMAAANEVQGLRAAGLSPVLANGAAGASVSAGTQGTASAPQLNPANMLFYAQLKNLNAQTDKIEADTQSQKIKNERDSHQDKSLSVNIAAYYRDLAARTEDEELKAWFENSAVAASEGKANTGDYDAMLKSLDLVGKPEEAIQRKLDRKLTAWLAELRWKKVQGQTMESSSFVKALATLDVRQSDLLAAEASNILASKNNSEQMIELTKAKIKLTNEQITQVKAAAEAMNDQNIMHWIDQGEYAKAFLAGLIQIFGGFAAKGRSYATNE